MNLTHICSSPGEEFHDVEDAETYKKMLARDERRFRVADQDGDSMATREELTAFLHPEEFPHMRDIVVAVSNIAEDMFPKPVLGPSILHKDSGHQHRCGRAPGTGVSLSDLPVLLLGVQSPACPQTTIF